MIGSVRPNTLKTVVVEIQ